MAEAFLALGLASLALGDEAGAERAPARAVQRAPP